MTLLRKDKQPKKCISGTKFPLQASGISMKTSAYKTNCKPLVMCMTWSLSPCTHFLTHTGTFGRRKGFSYPDVVLCVVEGPMGQKGMYSWLWMYSGASVKLSTPLTLQCVRWKYLCLSVCVCLCVCVCVKYTCMCQIACMHTRRDNPSLSGAHTCALVYDPWWLVEGLNRSRVLWLSTCPQCL